MKEMFYSIGRVLTAPFYFLHKGVSLLVQSGLIDIIVSVGFLFLAIGLFIVNQGSTNGEIMWNIFYILFLAVIYLIVMGIFHMAKNLILSIVFLILTPFAKFHVFCYNHSYGYAEASDRGNEPVDGTYTGKQEDTEKSYEKNSSFTHEQRNAGNAGIHQGCGML